MAGKRGPCSLCTDLSKTRARMKALNANSEFAAKRDALARARMKALNADPGFRARMKELHADPEFAARASSRMKALNADPGFKARKTEAVRQALCVRWTPEMDQALIDLWLTGTGLVICAEKIGVAPKTCRARVDHLGLAPHKCGRRSAAA